MSSTKWETVIVGIDRKMKSLDETSAEVHRMRAGLDEMVKILEAAKWQLGCIQSEAIRSMCDSGVTYSPEHYAERADKRVEKLVEDTLKLEAELERAALCALVLVEWSE